MSILGEFLIFLGMVTFNVLMSIYNFNNFFENINGEYASIYFGVAIFQVAAAGFITFPLLQTLKNE
ncbi:MAG: hypothetical protein GY827_04815 [Cytophagales bacterium]|nr:hypothetical protein [Cytophagales bacterium]